MGVIRLADAPAVPWANGRGTTRELVRREETAGRLRLRLSVAEVVEPGPFSVLPGLDRVLVLIDGPGFTLSVDGRTVPVLPRRPLTFAGDAAVAVTDIRAPSRDFNVMTARGLTRAEVAVCHESFTAPEAGFVFVVEGRWRNREGAAPDLGAGDLLEITRGWEGRIIDGAGCAIRVALAEP